MDSGISLDWWRRSAADTLPSTSGRLAYRALLAFTVMLVASPQQYFPIPPSLRIAFLFAALAVGAHVLDLVNGGGSGRPMPFEFVAVLGLLACAVVSVPTSMWPGGSLEVLTDRYLKSLAIFWLLGSVLNSQSRLRAMLWTLAATTVPVALTGIFAYLSGSFGNDGRIVVQISGLSSGLIGNPNDIALLLCLLLPLTGVLAITAAQRWARWLAWAAMGLSVGAIVLTLSRAGLLTLTAETLLFAGVLWRRKRRKEVAALVLATVITTVVLPAGFSERFSSMFGESQDSSARMRQEDQIVAVKYILSHPIIGAGLGADTFAMDDGRGSATYTHLHNVYLAYGVDLGAIGFVFFVALLIGSHQSARRVARSQRGTELGAYADGVRISLVGFMVTGFFAPVPYHFYFYYLSGLAVAVKEITARRTTGEGE